MLSPDKMHIFLYITKIARQIQRHYRGAHEIVRHCDNQTFGTVLCYAGIWECQG